MRLSSATKGQWNRGAGQHRCIVSVLVYLLVVNRWWMWMWMWIPPLTCWGTKNKNGPSSFWFWVWPLLDVQGLRPWRAQLKQWTGDSFRHKVRRRLTKQICVEKNLFCLCTYWCSIKLIFYVDNILTSSTKRKISIIIVIPRGAHKGPILDRTGLKKKLNRRLVLEYY